MAATARGAAGVAKCGVFELQVLDDGPGISFGAGEVADAEDTRADLFGGYLVLFEELRTVL